eukprot:TRINITY_DN17788_c0_g1_i2.p1 TRINITY_DN17788_c0_g1~~TRINITY_DN17788_c0_g1_i2.p1  ORF type:complete len:852 (+),score=125.93 TRINITY_DN17788_c0_g1_i2:208-2556(+)
MTVGTLPTMPVQRQTSPSSAFRERLESLAVDRHTTQKFPRERLETRAVGEPSTRMVLNQTVHLGEALESESLLHTVHSVAPSLVVPSLRGSMKSLSGYPTLPVQLPAQRRACVTPPRVIVASSTPVSTSLGSRAAPADSRAVATFSPQRLARESVVLTRPVGRSPPRGRESVIVTMAVGNTGAGRVPSVATPPMPATPPVQAAATPPDLDRRSYTPVRTMPRVVAPAAQMQPAQGGAQPAPALVGPRCSTPPVPVAMVIPPGSPPYELQQRWSPPVPGSRMPSPQRTPVVSPAPGFRSPAHLGPVTFVTERTPVASPLIQHRGLVQASPVLQGRSISPGPRLVAVTSSVSPSPARPGQPVRFVSMPQAPQAAAPELLVAVGMPRLPASPAARQHREIATPEAAAGGGYAVAYAPGFGSRVPVIGGIISPLPAERVMLASSKSTPVMPARQLGGVAQQPLDLRQRPPNTEATSEGFPRGVSLQAPASEVSPQLPERAEAAQERTRAAGRLANSTSATAVGAAGGLLEPQRARSPQSPPAPSRPPPPQSASQPGAHAKALPVSRLRSPNWTRNNSRPRSPLPPRSPLVDFLKDVESLQGNSSLHSDSMQSAPSPQASAANPRQAAGKQAAGAASSNAASSGQDAAEAATLLVGRRAQGFASGTDAKPTSAAQQPERGVQPLPQPVRGADHGAGPPVRVNPRDPPRVREAPAMAGGRRSPTRLRGREQSPAAASGLRDLEARLDELKRTMDVVEAQGENLMERLGQGSANAGAAAGAGPRVRTAG